MAKRGCFWDRPAEWEVEYLPALPGQTERRPVLRRKRRRGRGMGRFLALALACLAAIVSLSGALLTTFRALSETSGEGSLPALSGAQEEAEGSFLFDPGELTWEQKFKEIMGHSEDYPDQLLELAVRNPETIDYVYQYPALHDQPQDIDLSGEAEEDGVPLLLQWDTRWGYQEYGDGLLGYTGCGPTCLSMVALSLTGDAAATPAAVAAYAQENGYYVDGSGSMWTLMSKGCQAFGIRASELALDEARMAAALDSGRPLICALGPGDFTDSGHFIVITGYEDGAFTVNDPNSRQRSEQTWSFDQLRGQIRNIWAYTVL